MFAQFVPSSAEQWTRAYELGPLIVPKNHQSLGITNDDGKNMWLMDGSWMVDGDS